MNKKGNVTLYIVMIIAATTIVLLASVLAPLGTRFTTELYQAGEEIMLDAQPTIDQIQNATIRQEIQDSYDGATNAATTNINVLTDFYQYSWIIAIILVGLIVFLFTRSLTERQQGQGGFV